MRIYQGQGKSKKKMKEIKKIEMMKKNTMNEKKTMEMFLVKGFLNNIGIQRINQILRCMEAVK